ncbi:hypothetical protein VHEMI03270 [[Torrubiella] hemipterigena]|uniref:Small secreted protein n=1 Tax=[Torrubiella] hemipterigena TaxID=1531966 RepID=A0A0A1SY22_9HYPO|nr:hypothetical protein VHEMI03270 [[Torrubiella] hemipterigena]
MQFTKTIVAAILATAVSAAPTAEPDWTIKGLKRACDGTKSCTWNFTVDTTKEKTDCKYVVFSSGSTPADQANGGPSTCGPYTVTSGWSGQFGPDNGFTTFAVKNDAKKLISYPAYTDKEVKDGKTVADKSFKVYTF